MMIYEVDKSYIFRDQRLNATVDCCLVVDIDNFCLAVLHNVTITRIYSSNSFSLDIVPLLISATSRFAKMTVNYFLILY